MIRLLNDEPEQAEYRFLIASLWSYSANEVSPALFETRLIGSGRYVSSLSASASSASHRSTAYASMSAKSWWSMPGAPLFERHWA